MTTTPQTVADKLGAYLRGKLSLSQLVDWAEHQMMDAEFESDVVRDGVARIGVADVRTFGLTWEDCQQLLRQLGYATDVQIVVA